jgi:hypothetical protein
MITVNFNALGYKHYIPRHHRCVTNRFSSKTTECSTEQHRLNDEVALRNKNFALENSSAEFICSSVIK